MIASEVQEIEVFDTETTGVDVTEARVVTAFWGRMNRAGEWVEKRSWLINPGVPIPAEASAVHGITDERAQAEGADPKEAIFQILSSLQPDYGVPLVAYNAAFDLSLMKHEAKRHGFTLHPPRVVIDPFVIDKQLDKYRKGKRTLTVTAARYGIDIGDNAHDAEADCVAAGKLAFHFLGRVPLAPLALDYIHERQKVYAAEQAASLQEYFRKKDPSATVDGTWPIK